MKPRIYFRRGVWCCRLYFGCLGLGGIGHGYTPAEAFADWKAQAQ